MIRKLLFFALALIACSSHPDPAVTRAAAPLLDCYNAPPAGAIVGFGVNGQPRAWGSDGRAVKSALDALVNDLGATFFRVELNNGETDAETTNDDSNPATFNWSSFDADFSTPAMADTWDYVRYLNQLGVAHVELAQHGGIPMWMGTTAAKYVQDGRAYVLPQANEPEFVESCVALMMYARTRTLPPIHFDLFAPWNEPEFATQGEGIDIDSAQRARVLRALADRMNTLPELAGIKLVVGEGGSEAGMIVTRQAAQNDTVVMGLTAATSYHRYSDENAQVFGDWRGSSPPVWLTEFNSTYNGTCYDTSWTRGMQAAGNLLLALQNGATAGLAWSDVDAPHAHQANEWQTFGLLEATKGGRKGAQLCDDAPPTDAELDAMTYAPKPTYLALRHAFRWIRPNATPITMTATGGVLAVAYRNADGTVAVFGRANSTVSSTVTLTMQNPPSYLTPRITTSTSTDVVGSPVPLTNGQGVVSLPGGSVFTLSSTGSGSGGTGGSGGQGGNGGVSGDGTAGASSGAPSGGQSGSSGANAGGQSGAGGAASGAGGQSSGGAGQSGAGTSSGGAGAGGAAAGMAGASGSGGTGGALPALIAGWPFDEAMGTTTGDVSGRGHHGTIASGVTWTSVGCKFNNCLTFPGTSGKRVTVPDANDLDLTTNFTLMAWVLPSNTTIYRTVMIKEESAGLVYLLYAAPKEAWLDFGGGDVQLATASGSLSATAWSHVAFSYDGSSAKYWLNGAVVATSSQSGSVKSSTGLLAIGGHSFWGGEWFAGKIDDVRIYSAALTAPQVSTAMASGL